MPSVAFYDENDLDFNRMRPAMPIGTSPHERARLARSHAAVEVRPHVSRAFVRQMIGLGLTAPFAASCGAQAGLAQTATPGEYKRAKDGGGRRAQRLLFGTATNLLKPRNSRRHEGPGGLAQFYMSASGMDAEAAMWAAG